MITKEIIERIIAKNQGNEFKADKHFLYIYWGDKDDEHTCFEEGHLTITALDGAVEIHDHEGEDTTYVPYEEIWQLSINPDF